MYHSPMSVPCPVCHQLPLCVCDNDCGSYNCATCALEFYVNKEGVIELGHAPHCGLDLVEDRVEDHEMELDLRPASH